MNAIVFSRQEFYELVWSYSLLALSKKYSMSDNGLRKACVRMEIPLPDMGYWNKIKAGLKVAKKPLSIEYKGEPSIRLSLRQAGDAKSAEGLSAQLSLQQKMELDSTIDLKVKTILVSPDQLVINAQKSLQKCRYIPGELLRTSGENLDIRVSASFIDRALCLVDTFIKIMRQRGHDFKIKDKITYLLIAGEEMKMTLKEVQSNELEDGRFEKTGFHTKGELTFRFERFGKKISSSDGKMLIEEQLPKLVSKLEVLGEQFRKERAEQKKWRDEYEENLRIKKERAEHKRIEMNNVQQLLKEAHQSQRADELRRYLDRIERKIISDEEQSEETMKWLDWARKKADWIDPLTRTTDEWLEEEDLQVLLGENKPREYFSTGYHENVTLSKKWWPSQKWYSKK